MGQKLGKSNQFKFCASGGGHCMDRTHHCRQPPLVVSGIYITDINWSTPVAKPAARGGCSNRLLGRYGRLKSDSAANTINPLSLAGPIRLTAATALCLTTWVTASGALSRTTVNGLFHRQ